MNKFKKITKHFLDEKTFNQIGHGFFAIHKVKGISSAETLECLKEAIVKDLPTSQIIKDEKYVLRIGHGGTLDKTATGVLVVGICNGCKVLQQMLTGSKSYTGTGLLGIATDTYNETGAVTTETSYDHVTYDSLKKALKMFEGEIMQTPPVYSSLKRNGMCLSDLARRGDVVKLSPRSVICYKAMCTTFDPPHFTLDVDCGGGFYIRSLIHDLGKAVGSAAHLTSLVRTKQGPFVLNECLRMEDFTLQNVITWIKLSKKQHLKLTNHLESYLARRSNKQGYY